MAAERVILALGGGAARGLAHIGVLRGLAEDGIEVAGIAGTSMGSIIGALAAQDQSAADIEALFTEVDWARLGKIMLRSVVGTAFHDLLRETLGSDTIESLPRPFAAVCCDIDSGEQVALRLGPVADAVRASAAIPGVLTPLKIGERTLVDGAVVEPVPLTAARALGDDALLAVNVLLPPRRDERIATLHSLPRLATRRAALIGRIRRWLRRQRSDQREIDGELPNRWEAVMRSFHIMQYHLASASCEPVTMVEPDVGRFGWFDFHRAREIIGEGYRAYVEWKRRVAVDSR
jgi:NTE family protein